MITNNYQYQIKRLINDLQYKIERSVPEEGDFPMVYSEFRNHDKGLCLTDVLLTFRPVPNHLPDHETQRWLEVAGYKLPASYKSTMIIFKGTTAETLRYLSRPEAAEKIINVIPQLDFNLNDI